MYDRKDYDELNAQKADARVRDMMPHLRMVQAVAPVMQKMLTSFDHWNKYLEFLQAQVNRLAALKDHALAQLANPFIWEYEAMAKLKGDVLRAQAMIDALTLAMTLPRAIIDDAEKVQEIISKFEGQDEATGQPKS